MNESEDLLLVRCFTDILDRLDIGYVIGGSMASSIYGVVRFTQDADVTVEPFDNLAHELFEMLRPDYYISRQAMYQALREHSSFNIIHLTSAFKIDVFVRKNTAFEKQLIARGKKIKLSDQLKKKFSVVSPEDIILLKLRWYCDGGCSSQRQWKDALGVLAIQAGRLDFKYLNSWADKLKINKLLEKAVLETRQ
ncbi:MAG: hypothetical protein JXB29_05630 [Sedimentisphaerales bacterium]|nr:hypothetical protein [Sedimentisphaerales bacterium]